LNEQQEAAKKTTLRLIPYGLYVLGVRDGDEIAAGAINWVTQTSFTPPLVAMGVKTDSNLYAVLKRSGKFALSFLASGQKDLAFAFFKPTVVEGDKINGHRFDTAETGAPIITSATAWVEGTIVGELNLGDHSLFAGEVTNAHVRAEGPMLTLDEAGVKYGG